MKQLTASAFDRLGSDRQDVLGWLAQACRRPGCDLSVADLIRFCSAGQAQLILIHDSGPVVAAGVTQVRSHADGRLSCWILAVGGSGARIWRGTLGLIEAGAVAIGCERVEFVGRAGWRRLLPDYAAAPCPAGLHYTKALA